MTGRTIPLATGEYYHVYNRGAARQPTFITKKDYGQAILTLSYYRFSNPPVKLSRFKELSSSEREKILDTLHKKGKTQIDIISFVLMPNHFHFLLRQSSPRGVSAFISKFANSYTKYFNTKRERVGALFQGVFKVVHVETDEQLLHLSRYIHLNPLVSFVVKETDFLSYPWSSLPDYLEGKSPLIHLNPILEHFSSPKKYKNFVLDQADYTKRAEEIKHLSLDTEE